ncbi:DUF547 domain-containing protein [Candidatus Poribacteria bacterium]|nr:DUF547 domain-containing protein [Candidatus Poribacteria bacterium]
MPIRAHSLVSVAAALMLLSGARASAPRILNDPTASATEAPEPDESVPARLRKTANRLVAQFVDGKRVDYEGLSQSPAFAEYRELAARLDRFDPGELATHDEQVAFWVNLYNALVMHSVLDSGVTTSVRERERFFDLFAYRIGGLVYTPNDIEHGILRGVSILHTDPRFRFVVARLDPRIHFALNCASAGCPPIAAYDADRLDEQLDTAARAFVNSPSEVRLDAESNTLHLSAIFDWYRDDFGEKPRSEIDFIARMLSDDATREYIEEHRDTLRLVYNDYDWSLNH